jgi:hypothetical protein
MYKVIHHGETVEYRRDGQIIAYADMPEDWRESEEMFTGLIDEDALREYQAETDRLVALAAAAASTPAPAPALTALQQYAAAQKAKLAAQGVSR